MKYTNKNLRDMITSGLILVKGGAYYDDKIRQSLVGREVNVAGIEDIDLVHEELWWDTCEVVVDLSQALLDEREAMTRILSDLKRSLKDSGKEVDDLLSRINQ